MVGLAILFNSMLTLYFIPKPIMELMVHQAFFRLNILLISIVVGMVFLS